MCLKLQFSPHFGRLLPLAYPSQLNCHTPTSHRRHFLSKNPESLKKLTKHRENETGHIEPSSNAGESSKAATAQPHQCNRSILAFLYGRAPSVKQNGTGLRTELPIQVQSSSWQVSSTEFSSTAMADSLSYTGKVGKAAPHATRWSSSLSVVPNDESLFSLHLHCSS